MTPSPVARPHCTGPRVLPMAGTGARLAALLATSLAVLLAGCGGGGGGGQEVTGPLTITSAPTPASAGNLVFTFTTPPEVTGSIKFTVRTASLGTGLGLATGGAACGGEVDYIIRSDSEFTVADRTATFSVALCPNAALEPNERFELQADWPTGLTRAVGVIVNDARGGLNDTGITQCQNAAGAMVACAGVDIAGQDATHGRDSIASVNGNADGRAGFQYANVAGGCHEDRVTGLTWSPAPEDAATTAMAATRVQIANGGSLCGFSDWRLPTTEELLGLVDAGAAASPRIDARFLPTAGVPHWTGTPYAGDNRAAWVVDFANGAAAFETISNPLAKTIVARLVRGTSAAYGACDEAAPARFTDHGNGTVTDTATALMWQQCSDGQSGAGCATGNATVHASFAAAHARAGAVNADASGAGRGHGDWRVPNRNELASLVHRACEAPAIQRSRFPATRAASYWTSSPAGTGRAWYVDFNDGSVGFSGSTGDRHLRLVRGGQ